MLCALIFILGNFINGLAYFGIMWWQIRWVLGYLQKAECWYCFGTLSTVLNISPLLCFVKESASEDGERDITATVMGIYTVVRDGEDEPKDVGIVIEGTKVLQNMDSVMKAFIVLFGLIYALDLSYPDTLKYTFEFCQKIIMNLDGHNLNAKIQQLKIKLFG